MLKCPGCGKDLDCREGFYQCLALDCLSLFSADEIEPLNPAPIVEEHTYETKTCYRPDEKPFAVLRGDDNGTD
jgi:hypothetical protein